MSYEVRMKEWITDHDILQKSLAKEFNVTEAMMSHYMTGKNEVTVDVVVKFAKKFSLSTDFLLGLSDEPQLSMQLNETERQLIEIFRTLSRDQREAVYNQVQFFQKQNQRG